MAIRYSLRSHTRGRAGARVNNRASSLTLTLMVSALLTPAKGFADSSWFPSGPMVHERTGHTVTLLQDGRVLVTGGSDHFFNPVNTVESYDPTTGTWVSLSPMLEPRGGHTATLLNSGKVLVVGGISISDPLVTAEVYDPVADRWSKTGALSDARAGHTATLLDSGKVLVVGGYAMTGPLNTLETYDPLSAAWSRTRFNLSVPRGNHTATKLSNGRVLIVGGDGHAAQSYLTATELFVPDSEAVVYVTDLAVARSNHVAALLPNDRVLVVGGCCASPSAQDLFLSSAELFNYSTQHWTSAGVVSVSGYGKRAVVLSSGRVLVAGGTNGIWSTKADLFDPLTSTWSPTTPLWIARARHSLVVMASGKVLAAGGDSTLGLVLSGSEIYGLFAVPNPSSAAPRQSRSFTASGGSGTGYVWSYVTNSSGGQLNSSSGAYTAGLTPNVIDVLKVTDSQENADIVTVTVTAGVSISPSNPSIPPRGILHMSASGGSGAGFVWTLDASLSGATIGAGGIYTAGSTANVSDVIRVTDSLGNGASATVTVTASVSVSPKSTSLQPKMSQAFSASGGSGTGYIWALASNGSGATLNPSTGVYTAGAISGTTDIVQVTDSLGNSASATITVTGGGYPPAPGGCDVTTAAGADALLFLVLLLLPFPAKRRRGIARRLRRSN